MMQPTLVMQLPRVELIRMHSEQPRSGKVWTSTKIMTFQRLSGAIGGRVCPWMSEEGPGAADCTSEDLYK